MSDFNRWTLTRPSSGTLRQESDGDDNPQTTNVLCVGIGGQGVLTVSEVLAQAAFEADTM
jgi:hypothetical protein